MFVATKSFFIFDTSGNARPVAEGATITRQQYDKLNDIKKGFCVPYVSPTKAAKLEAAADRVLAELMAG
jgi:hypothetical protein